jgi:hypothetical protein
MQRLPGNDTHSTHAGHSHSLQTAYAMYGYVEVIWLLCDAAQWLFTC